MKLDYPYQYTEERIPPRCRKSRRVTMDAVLRVTIREAAPSQAPVAIIEHGHTFAKNGDWRRYSKVYRAYKGKLFVRLRDRDGKPERIEAPPPGHEGRWQACQSQAERVKSIREWARNHILIRGQAWEAIGEPRFRIATFGLGRNHSGTSLLTANDYNSNVANHCYFRADQFEQAVAAAERVALARGDTKSVPIRPSTRYKVLMPQVLRLNPRRQHGKGNPFLNKVEKVVQATKDPAASGLLVMGMALLQ